MSRYRFDRWEERVKKAAERNDNEGDEAVSKTGERAVHNGYCWVYEGERAISELGYCPKCYRYWGSSIKWLTCVCGESVSLT